MLGRSSRRIKRRRWEEEEEEGWIAWDEVEAEEDGEGGKSEDDEKEREGAIPARERKSVNWWTTDSLPGEKFNSIQYMRLVLIKFETHLPLPRNPSYLDSGTRGYQSPIPAPESST